MLTKITNKILMLPMKNVNRYITYRKQVQYFGIKYLYVLLACFCMFFYSCTSKHDKIFKYKNLEVKIPTDWLTETKETSQDYGYVIVCMDEKNTRGFILKVTKFEINLESEMETVKKSMIENSDYDDLTFSDNFSGDYFSDNPTICSDCSYHYSNMKINGKIIVFNKNKKTFSFMCLNQDNINNTGFDKFMISSVTINSAIEDIKMQTVKHEQVEFQIPANWLHYFKEFEHNDGFSINSYDKHENNMFFITLIYSEDDDLDNNDLDNIITEYAKKPFQKLFEDNNFTNIYFSDNKNGEFRNYETLYFDYSVTASGIKQNGKTFAFYDGEYIYVITYAGTNYFYDNKINEMILSSLKFE